MPSLDHTITGHTAQQQDLLRALTHGQLGQAYLFSGSAGIGKGLVARALARAMVCESRTPEGSACGTCRQCQMELKGIHPDVQRFQRDKTTFSVELMREGVLTWASRKPREGHVKIGILDDVEDLGTGAANAFLKTLEEPPPGTLWILLTSSHGRTLSTIVSRCRTVFFESLQPGQTEELLRGPLAGKVRELLAQRPEAESGDDDDEATGQALAPAERQFVVQQCQGAPGKALELLECQAHSLRDKLVECIEQRTEGGPLACADGLFAALGRKDEATQAGLRRRLELLISVAGSVVRDIWRLRVMPPSRGQGLLNLDRLMKLQGVAEEIDPEALLQSLQMLDRLHSLVERNVSPKVLLANLALSLWTMRPEVVAQARRRA